MCVQLQQQRQERTWHTVIWANHFKFASYGPAIHATYEANLYIMTHYMPENGWSGYFSSPFLSSGVPVLSSYPNTKFNICEIVFTYTTICYYSCVLCFKRKVCRSSALMDTFTYAVKKYNFSVVFIVGSPCTDCPHTQIAKFLSWYETVSEMVRPDHFRMYLLLATCLVVSRDG